MHGLDPRDGNGPALLHEVGGQRLGARHVLLPRVPIRQVTQGRVHGEVGGRDVVEIVPAHRVRHGDAGTHRGL